MDKPYMLPQVPSRLDLSNLMNNRKEAAFHGKEGKTGQGKSRENQAGSARFGVREIGRASQFAIPRVTAQLPAFH